MGFSWKAFAKIAEMIAPALLEGAGVPVALIPLVVHGIQLAETKPGATGPEKKAYAMDVVTTGVSAINAAKPGTIDVPQLTGAVSDGIDASIKGIKAAKNIPVHPDTPPVQP